MSRGVKKLDALKQQQSCLRARIDQMEAREKTKDKKQELRKRILVGEFVLERAKKDDKVAELAQEMDGFLKRNSDRVLFGLGVREGGTKEAGESKKEGS